jgi:hypothetical protein
VAGLEAQIEEAARTYWRRKWRLQNTVEYGVWAKPYKYLKVSEWYPLPSEAQECCLQLKSAPDKITRETAREWMKAGARVHDDPTADFKCGCPYCNGTLEPWRAHAALRKGSHLVYLKHTATSLHIAKLFKLPVQDFRKYLNSPEGATVMAEIYYMEKVPSETTE